MASPDSALLPCYSSTRVGSRRVTLTVADVAGCRTHSCGPKYTPPRAPHLRALLYRVRSCPPTSLPRSSRFAATVKFRVPR